MPTAIGSIVLECRKVQVLLIGLNAKFLLILSLRTMFGTMDTAPKLSWFRPQFLGDVFKGNPSQERPRDGQEGLKRGQKPWA